MLMTTAYHRLQRLPVSHDRPTCRRRRGVECADAGHPQSDRRPHRPRRACKSPPYCTPRKPTFFPPQVQDRCASRVRVRVRLRASRVLGSLKGGLARLGRHARSFQARGSQDRASHHPAQVRTGPSTTCRAINHMPSNEGNWMSANPPTAIANSRVTLSLVTLGA
jgi:hypothetical protein